MISTVAPWQRPAYCRTDRRATVTLIAFADEDVLRDRTNLEVRDSIPETAPDDALELRLHRYADSPAWVDGWRTDSLRTIATEQLDDLERLDQASCCYSINVAVDDPADLSHLQLAWAVAAELAKAGSFAVLDAFAANWLPGPAVAELSPTRPFALRQEVSLVAEAQPIDGFGHLVHTRGMIKFARPDLLTVVPADQLDETGEMFDYLGRMLADGHTLSPGQRLRFDGRRTLVATPYFPGTSHGGVTLPDVYLNNDGLVLLDG